MDSFLSILAALGIGTVFGSIINAIAQVITQTYKTKQARKELIYKYRQEYQLLIENKAKECIIAISSIDSQINKQEWDFENRYISDNLPEENSLEKRRIFTSDIIIYFPQIEKEYKEFVNSARAFSRNYLEVTLKSKVSGNIIYTNDEIQDLQRLKSIYEDKKASIIDSLLLIIKNNRLEIIKIEN